MGAVPVGGFAPYLVPHSQPLLHTEANSLLPIQNLLRSPGTGISCRAFSPGYVFSMRSSVLPYDGTSTSTGTGTDVPRLDVECDDRIHEVGKKQDSFEGGLLLFVFNQCLER